jgi:DNA integrity scanning protein DisA with diadenylate cyclase activity
MGIDEAMFLHYKSLSKQRKVELWLVVALSILGILAFVFIVQTTRKAVVDHSWVKVMEEQNIRYQQQNAVLLKTVGDLNESIQERNVRDSLTLIAVENNNRISSNLNNQITQINRKYEKALVLANDDDILKYLRSEYISSKK